MGKGRTKTTNRTARQMHHAGIASFTAVWIFMTYELGPGAKTIGLRRSPKAGISVCWLGFRGLASRAMGADHIHLDMLNPLTPYH